MKTISIEEKKLEVDTQLISAVGYVLGHNRCHNNASFVYGNTDTGKSSLVRMLVGICRDNKKGHGEPAASPRFGDMVKGGL